MKSKKPVTATIVYACKRILRVSSGCAYYYRNASKNTRRVLYEEKSVVYLSANFFLSLVSGRSNFGTIIFYIMEYIR
jgi:hypothetical protein